MQETMSAQTAHAARAQHGAAKRLVLLGSALAVVLASSPAAHAHNPGSVKKARRHIVNRALNQVGVRYRYGSESPRRGFDCSGLTWWAFNKHGASLPRSSKDQFKIAGAGGYRRVWARGKLVKGDLVFFKTTKARVGHVGIYIGNNRFVSATSSRGVRVDSVFDPYYWGRRYVGATRVRL
jgi:cell wall-associated NlpC family hydrolase